MKVCEFCKEPVLDASVRTIYAIQRTEEYGDVCVECFDKMYAVYKRICQENGTWREPVSDERVQIVYR